MFRLSLAAVIATVCLVVCCPGTWAQVAVEEPPVAMAASPDVVATPAATASPAHLTGTYDTG